MASTPNAQNAAILVSSCDAYSDLWPLFFHLFFKHWQSPTIPVYLLSNHRFYKDPRVIPVRVGNDRSWSDNMMTCLESIPEENLFMWLDDFFVDREINGAELSECITQLDRVGGKYLGVDQYGDDGASVADSWFRQIEGGNLKAGLNLSLWRKAFLSQLLSPDCSIWAVESRLRKLNREGEPGLYYMKSEAPKVVSYVEGVKGQFWKPPAVEFFRKQGIPLNLKRRPFPPQGRGVFSKLIRSLYKRRMKVLSAREVKKALMGQELEVQPLPASF